MVGQHTRIDKSRAAVPISVHYVVGYNETEERRGFALHAELAHLFVRVTLERARNFPPA